MSILKCIINTNNKKQLAKRCYSSQSLKNHFAEQFLAELQKQVRKLCSKKFNSILFSPRSQDLLNFQFKTLLNEWETNAPLFMKILSALSISQQTKSGKKHDAALGFLGASALFLRNNKLSLLHHIVGQLLDSGGTTDQVSQKFWMLNITFVFIFKFLYSVYIFLFLAHIFGLM